MKSIIAKSSMLAALVAMPALASAQDKVEASVGADLVSSYVWRGAKLDNASVQPAASLSYKGFTLGAWGSIGLINNSKDELYKEFDLTLSYTTGGFTVGVTDYYIIPSDNDNRYFMYEAHKTSHVFEVNVGYDFGVLSVNWYTNFAGCDGINEDGDRAYSSYFELAAPFKLGGLDWTAAVGAVPYCTDFYDDGVSDFAVTNITLTASKDIKITESFSLPLFGSITANPHTSDIYFTAGVSF